ncbi:MAG: hypothetical protein ACXIVQ_17675 [Acidimicrobiales bacterium]
MSRSSHRVAVTAVFAALVVLTAACTGDSTEAFCRAAEATRSAGPLLPDRADGAPIVDASALAAIEDLADDVPEEIADDVDVVVAEARGLAAEIAGRDDGGLGPPPTGDRPERPAVEQAQARVVRYVADECGIDLTSSGEVDAGTTP